MATRMASTANKERMLSTMARISMHQESSIHVLSREKMEDLFRLRGVVELAGFGFFSVGVWSFAGGSWMDVASKECLSV